MFPPLSQLSPFPGMFSPATVLCEHLHRRQDLVKFLRSLPRSLQAEMEEGKPEIQSKVVQYCLQFCCITLNPKLTEC